MARHSNGKNSFAVAGWVIAVAIITLLAIIALVAFLLRGAGNGDGEDSAAPAAVESSTCLLYTSPSPRDRQKSRMPSSA